MDLNTKRLRLNEYVASMLSIRLGEGIRRVLAYGSKVTLEQVESNIFNFNGNLVIQLLQNSELLTYSDLSNDLDFFSKIRYTVNFSRVYKRLYTVAHLIAGNSLEIETISSQA